jgi:hypothetical protein
MKSLDRTLRPPVRTAHPPSISADRLSRVADPNIVQYRGYVKTTEFLYIILESVPVQLPSAPSHGGDRSACGASVWLLAEAASPIPERSLTRAVT